MRTILLKRHMLDAMRPPGEKQEAGVTGDMTPTVRDTPLPIKRSVVCGVAGVRKRERSLTFTQNYRFIAAICSAMPFKTALPISFPFSKGTISCTSDTTQGYIENEAHVLIRGGLR